MVKGGKREYQKKLTNELFEHREFLFERLRKEWEQLEKEARKEQIVRQAKEAGQTAVIVTVKTMLALLAIGGILTVGMIAPNIFGAVGRSNKRSRFFNKKNFNEAKHYLKRQNYVKIKKDGRALEMDITEKGMRKVLQGAFNDLKVAVSGKWDGIWRIVIFDIPDRHKWARDGFRRKLNEMGFYQMQESVFVMPYPCEEEIEFLVSTFNISSYARLIKAPFFAPDDDVKDYFHLN